MKVLLEIIPSLSECWISNCNIKKTLTTKLVYALSQQAPRLAKLRLSNINLNDRMHVAQLSTVIANQQDVLLNLDLSHSKLTPKSMAHIAEQLRENSTGLKNLNLSYNPLTFTKGSREQAFSRNFVKNMNEFLKHADILNHIDLSGLLLPKEQLLYLSETLSSCPNLMAIHLSDNGIMSPWNNEILDEMTDIFLLGEVGTARQVKSKGGQGQADEHVENGDLDLHDSEICELIDTIENDVVRSQLEERASTAEKEETYGRKRYKQHLIA